MKRNLKSNITIVLSMILGLVCFALAGLFFRAAFGSEDRSQSSNVIHASSFENLEDHPWVAILNDTSVLSL